MKERKDQFEQFITDNFEKLAKQEEDKLKNDSDIQMPEGVRESVRAKLDDEIKKIEEQEAYARLSEEDRRALELGRKLMKEEAEPQTESAEEQDASAGTAKRRTFGSRKLRVCLILAAALILVMAVGITSLGGPERVIQMLTQNVGEREVEKVNSSEDNLVIVEENEEEAFQIIEEEFGVEPVKLITGPQNLRFEGMCYDKALQTSELTYVMQDKKIVCIISALYGVSSLGMDLDDVITDEYIWSHKKCKVYVTEYEVKNSKSNKYLANFTYKKLEYFIIGEGTRKEFEEILDGLYFYQ